MVIFFFGVFFLLLKMAIINQIVDGFFKSNSVQLIKMVSDEKKKVVS